jgi:hypothetical protein
MTYPNNCIKGVKHPRYLNDDDTVGTDLFFFEAERGRLGWKDQSINWEDNDTVIDFTLSQERTDGDLLFKGGAVIFPRQEIERLNKLGTIRGALSYERAPFEGNKFHGNILLAPTTPKHIMVQIAASLRLLRNTS